jgi:hypothetical protein
VPVAGGVNLTPLAVVRAPRIAGSALLTFPKPSVLRAVAMAVVTLAWLRPGQWLATTCNW